MFTFTEKQNVFIQNDDDVNTQSLANYLPDGEYFRAKNINNSNLRKLLKALSKEYGRVEGKLVELIDEHYIGQTVNLLSEWEGMLNIPDECLKIENKTQDERRKQAIAKYALMNLTNIEDFVSLAAYFDIKVEILNGFDFINKFTFTFPVLLFNSNKAARFTMVVYFPEIDPPSNTFPMTFDFTFQDNPVKFIVCLFNKLKPSPVKIITRFKGQI